MGLRPLRDGEKGEGVLDPFYPKFSEGDLVEQHDFGRCYFWNERARSMASRRSYPIRDLVRSTEASTWQLNATVLESRPRKYLSLAGKGEHAQPVFPGRVS